VRTVTRRIAVLAGAACLLLFDGASSAQPLKRYEFDRTGPYAGIGMAFGQLTEVGPVIMREFEQVGTFGKVKVDSSLGVNGRLGWRLHANLAAEFAFEYFPQAVARLEGDSFADFSGGLLSVNMKPYFLTGRYQPFAQIGFGVQRVVFESTRVGLDLRETDHGIAGRFGAGIDVYITRNIAVTADAAYVLPSGAIEDFDQVVAGLGLLYRY